MKLWLVVAYVALIAAGAIGIALRARRSFEFRASRALPCNHRLLSTDLREPDMRWAFAPTRPRASEYIGRYLKRRVEAGNPIDRQDLMPRPAVTPGAGVYSWLLKDDEIKWLRVLDVGWRVDLCAESCPVMDAPILALDCPSGDSGPCAAVLQLTTDQEKHLMACPYKSKLRLTVSRVEFGESK